MIRAGAGDENTVVRKQLQAELGALKDRVQVLERIATDEGRRLSREIDNLRH